MQFKEIDTRVAQAETKELQDWITDTLRPRLGDYLVRGPLFDRVLSRIDFLPDVIERQQSQPEFVIPIWEYLNITTSPSRIRAGRKVLRERRDLFNRIERNSGVGSHVVAAIWGLETNYGAARGHYPVISALASLAWKGRRGTFFENELLAAFRIVQSGHIDDDEMTGSWAGAMGHGQFMPTSFLDCAVDMDGDGRADIWHEDPADGLASIAQYLVHHGWRRGQPWGIEVALPDSFDFSLAGLDQAQGSKDWTALGLVDIAGQPIPDYGSASILLPAGADGPAFMVFANYRTILAYNRAEAYAIAVGHLSDRLNGGKAISTAWPQDAILPDREGLRELQEHLTTLGFDTMGIDGLRGPNTTNAVRAFQVSQGMRADGFPTVSLLEKVRNAA